MLHPLFSIIITVLNGSATLEACLASIAEQTFESFELIVVDGGSVDNTIAILEQYNHTVTKLTVKPGIGLYAGLNTGIDLATGEWLYFMGCDDCLFSIDTLRRVAETAQHNSVHIIAGSVKYTSGYVMTPRFGSPYMMQYRLHHQGTFYNRHIFEQFRYSEELRISSDYELNTRLALAHTSYCEIKSLIAIYGEKGVSSVQYEQNFMEVRIVNRRLFTGPAYYWVIAYCWVQQSIWLIRNQLGLLNLKYRLKYQLKRIKR